MKTQQVRFLEKASIVSEEYIYYYEQNVAIDDMHVKGEVSDGNEEYVFGHWRKSVSCCKVAENLARFQRPQGTLGQDIILI